VVGDGKQAIERIVGDRPDIVLADIGMPERDGYEVASFIKSTPEFSHIPVLLLTGAFEPVDEARSRAVGADGVLVKPFEPQMVISRVRELLDRQSDPASEPAMVAARPASAAATASPTAKPSSVGTAELDRLEPSAPIGGSRDALEDYFDRLDAALASMSTAPPPLMEEAAPFDLSVITPPGQQADSVPEIVLNSGTTLPPPSAGAAGSTHLRFADALLPTPPPQPQAAPPSPLRPVLTPVAPAAKTPAPPPPTLVPPRVEATRADVPTPMAPEPAAPVSAQPGALHEAFAALLSAEQGRPIAPAPGERMSEEAIEAIVRQVVSRMNDEDMRRMVLDAAERLVREEI
ncbi:MAG: response regulator, partial [Dongiaceae bacterium]